MQGAGVGGILAAEVHATGDVVVARDVNGVFDELVDALVLGSGDGHDGHAQQGLEQVDVDRPAVGRDLVHHVERDDHRDLELHQLQGEVEVALDVGRVHDVDHGVGPLVQDELAAHDLLARVGGEAVDAGQVGDGGLRVAAHVAVLAVHCDAGKVANMLVGARELVEEGCLARVLVARQGEGERCPLGLGLALGVPAVLPLMTLAGRRALAELGVGRAARGRVGTLRDVGVVHGPQLDQSGVCLAQGELVAAQPDLERVAERGGFDHGHLGPRGEAHVEDVLAERSAIAGDGRDNGVLADLEFIERHMQPLFCDALT